MPSEAASPEDRRMTIFHAIAPDGTYERLRFESEAEPMSPRIDAAKRATASIGSSGPRASNAGSASPKTAVLDLPLPPARHQPPGLRVVGERWCSLKTEIIP
jgi:hypothetical protein